MKLANFSVGKKIAILLGGTALLMSAQAAFTWVSLQTQASKINALVSTDVPQIKYMTDIHVAVLELRRYEKDMLINLQSTEKVTEYEKKWREQIDVVKKSADESLQLPLPDDLKKEIETIKTKLPVYETGMNTLMADIKAAKFPDAASANMQIDGFKNAVRDIGRHAADTQFQLTIMAKDRATAAEKNLTTTQITLGLTLLAGLVGLLVGGLWIVRQIVGPLQATTRLAEAVSHGDLTQTVVVKSNDEIGQLASACNQMVESLRKLVADVRNGMDHMASASQQIAQGNQDLSSRTEQQAGSLEETAASMEEFTSSVQANADAAREAAGFVENASQVAQRGGDVVGQVVSTMGEIEASSKKINDIIGVIDGIAFQTNILALNAAVEAARAGEQGRGFAVVASEVRSLAQRSASAAKEIKGLIQESVSKVGEGSRLVDDAGKTMADIVKSVQSVTDIMHRITNSTLEQSSGISQVNQAVGQLDQMTQQNAALVEEASAAATSLKEQAAKLVSAVNFFKLDAGAVASAVVHAPANAPLKPATKRVTKPAAPIAVPKPSQPKIIEAQPAPAKVPAPKSVVPKAQPKVEVSAASKTETPSVKNKPASVATATPVAPMPVPTATPAPATTAKPANKFVKANDDDWEEF